MANAEDVYKAINNVNTHLDGTNSRLDNVTSKLDDLKAATDAVRVATEEVNSTLKAGFAQLLKFVQYADLALYQNALQNDTIICDLEKISKNTCDISNEAHLQTALQTIIEKSTTALAAMYSAAHAEVALTLERERALRQEIEKCCPPPQPEPTCRYSPCPAPQPLGPPPSDRVQPPG